MSDKNKYEELEDEHKAKLAELEVIEKKRELGLDTPDFNYRLVGQVNAKSVRKAIRTLRRWRAEYPGQPISFTINSPGGDVPAGMELFDELYTMSIRGGGSCFVRTIVRGEAASMGAVLSQAGDVRIMGPHSLMMLHESSWASFGKKGEMQDTQDCLSKTDELVKRIFLSRSTFGSARWDELFNRRDWWLTADECLEFEFVDRLG